MKVFGIVVAVLILIAGVLALNGWLIMITWGAVASIFGWPTASFGQSIGAAAFLSLVGGFFKNFGSKS